MIQPRIYLAGPAVFRPDAAAHGRALVALCSHHGFEGVFPLDESLPAGLPDLAAAERIYRANIAHIEACDAVVADLGFFRGPEPDSGTCFEIGYAVARGKPVVAHVPESGALRDRIRERFPEAVDVLGHQDTAGWQVEHFGLPLNLMLGVPCRVVVGGAEAALELLRREGLALRG